MLLRLELLVQCVVISKRGLNSWSRGLQPDQSQGTRLCVVAGWSSPVARQAHNLKVAGSNPAPATKKI